jgi:hypothetical protein
MRQSSRTHIRLAGEVIGLCSRSQYSKRTRGRVLGVKRRGPFGIFDFGFRIAPHLLPATFEEMAPITLSYHVGVIVCTFVQQDAGKLRVITVQSR